MCYLTLSGVRSYVQGMTTNNAGAVDWVLCLAWSMGYAILTALVGLTAVNAPVTFGCIKLDFGKAKPHRWVGKCRTCRKAHRVDGALARGWLVNHEEQIVVSGSRCYCTGGQGTNATVIFVTCSCETRVKLQRVFDGHKHGRERHECNAKCLASTGPSCECKCKGANHGSSAAAA